MGAVYQAAALSKAFKVKPFIVRDAAVFPIQVTLGLLSLVQSVGKRGCAGRNIPGDLLGSFELGSYGDVSANLIKEAE